MERLVWVSLTHAAPSFAEIPDLRADHLRWFARRHYRMECNWKVFVDNYLDGGYHVPQLHQRPRQGPGLCRISDRTR